MEPILQKDPRWADVEIVPGHTIGTSGCLLCCICMANHVLGNYIYPDQLCRELKAVGGFDEQGNLLWAKLQHTSSRLWMRMNEAIPLRIGIVVEYLNAVTSQPHFVFYYYIGQERGRYNPNPEAVLGKVLSTRLLARISSE